MKQDRLTFGLALRRALRGYCPCCGKGKLFSRYLKQVNQCDVCHEDFGHIRADDGPAWLTILLVGHIIVPIALTVALNTDTPDWVNMTLWPALAFLLILLVLPRAKGAFIAIIWKTGCAGSEKD